MKPLLLGALCGLLAGCGGGGRPTSVLFVVVDTLRADHTSLHGYARPTTPTLEALAAEGLSCERAYSQSSWTMPSMAQMMTGQVRSSNAGQVFDWQLSLAQTLQANDYATGAVVANPLLNAEQGYARGFDSFAIRERGTPEGRQWGNNSWPAAEVNRHALQFLNGVGEDEAFYLWVHYFDPHDPYVPRGGQRYEAYAEPAREQAFRDALPPEQREELTPEVYAELEERIALYDSEVWEADQGLAQLLRVLEDTGRAEDTLVVFTSDHGEGLWQRAPLADEEYNKPNAYFPRLYFDHGIMLQEEQVRVPLVMRGPGVPAGRVIDSPVSTVDLVPTVLARLGVEPYRELHGGDLCADAPLERSELYAACSRSTSLTVDGRWRLHLPRPHRLERGAQPELYDLVDDPGETRPLDDPERERALRAALEHWMELFANEAGTVSYSDAMQALLEAQGYTGGEADTGD